MDFTMVLEQGLKTLPLSFKNAYKKGKAVLSNQPGGRDIVYMPVNGIELKFNLFYAQQISHLQLHYIQMDATDALQKDQLPTLVVCPVIYPKIAQKLVDMNINYIDSLGNVYINDQTIYILSTGKKSKSSEATTKSRLFGESGLKLLFALLQDQEAIDFSYRELAGLVNISPASITILFKELLRSGYLFEDHHDQKRLLRKRELLQRWISGYHEILRPKLLIGTYETIKKDLVRNFNKQPISEWNGSWGGEPAAAIYTNYLVPEVLTMYVTNDEKGWMKKMGLIPTEGTYDIAVLQYFWDKDHPLFRVEQDTVPPLLAYAELMATGDSRNIETAQKIYDEYLQFIEQ